jgi:hypothetical protein
LVPAGGYLHFADVQHYYLRFYPHRVEELPFEDVLIDGETASYVSIDRSWGIVCVGWEYPSPVCFFGEVFTRDLRLRSLRLFNRLVPLK